MYSCYYESTQSIDDIIQVYMYMYSTLYLYNIINYKTMVMFIQCDMLNLAHEMYTYTCTFVLTEKSILYVHVLVHVSLV